VAIMNVTLNQQNLTARQLLKSKRHLWMRVGKYKIVLHGYGEQELYWCVQIVHTDNKTNIYHVVGEHSDSWHTGWSKFFSIGDAVNNALSAIVEIERNCDAEELEIIAGVLVAIDDD
jgi:hypothetical protein